MINIKIISKNEYNEIKPKISILIMSAANIERDAINRVLIPIEGESEILKYKDYFIGKFGKYNVVHVKTEQGSVGRDSSVITTYEALADWNIKMLVMIGIACGRDKGWGQKIGDVLISKSIFFYEKCKVEEDEEGEIIYNKCIGTTEMVAGSKLCRIFENQEEWKEEFRTEDNRVQEYKVYPGQIFSGEKFINSKKEKERIMKLSPSVCIGIEMEGAGIATACSRKELSEWIIVKAICDFGDGKNKDKDKAQKRAIDIAISYCMYKFNQNKIFDHIIFEEEYQNDEEKIIHMKKYNYDITENYIERKVISIEKSILFSEKSKENLYDVIKDKKHVVLLSDAGEGKTQEAKALANKINNDNSNIHAFYKDLSTYTDQKIEDIIPKELKSKKTVCIFDGFDEIVEKNKSTFSRNLLEFCQNNPNAMIVVTCRKNFYERHNEDYEGTLKKFNEYILCKITDEDIKKTLTKNNIIIDKFYKDISDQNLSPILYNPFYFKNILKIYNKKEFNEKDLLDIIIEKSFDLDKNKYDTDKSKLNKLLEIIGITIQMIERKYLTNEEYMQLINDEERLLLSYSSIWHKNDDGNWSFIHNNFGEYLAAKRLNTYSLEKIKDIVCYKGVESKIKPTWINTLTFLVNKYKDKELIEWILSCMPEFITYIESGIINEEKKRKMLFIIYEKCKEQKTWITYNIYHSNNLISSKEEIKYLLKQIEENYHYTSVGNALHILKNSSNLFGMEREIRNVLMSICLSDNHTTFNISNAMDLLSDFKLAGKEELIKIIKYNEKRENPKLRRCYFYFCNTLNIVDDTIDIFLERFKIESKGMCASWNSENEEDAYYLNEHIEYRRAFSKIKSKNTIEKVVDFIESEYINDREDIKKIIENLCDSIHIIFENSEDKIKYLLEMYLKCEERFSYACMKLIIDKVKAENMLLLFFKEYMKIDNTKLFRAYEQIIDNECLEYYYEEYKNGGYSNEETKDILKFCNEKLTKYRDLKILYESRAGSKIVETKQIDYNEIKKKSIIYFLDKLFYKQLFFEFLKEFKKEYKKEEINTEDFIEDIDYNDVDRNCKYQYLTEFLLHKFDYGNIVDENKIKEWNWSDVILDEVYNILNSEQEKIELTVKQIDIIEKICKTLINKTDFRNGIIYDINNSISTKIECLYLWFFRYKFNFEYPKDKLLDMLEYDWIINGGNLGIDYIEENIEDKTKLTARIIDNIKNRDIHSYIYKNHIEYCIKNNIDSCMESIGTHLLDKNADYDERIASADYLLKFMNVQEFVNEYFNKLDLEFQKEIIWKVIEKKRDILDEWIVDKLKTCEEIKDKMFFAQQLIKLNKEEGIEFYYNWVKKENKAYEDRQEIFDINLDIAKIQNYNMLNYLIRLIEITINPGFKDNTIHSLNNSLKRAIINIGTKSSDTFIKTKNRLQELIKNNQKNNHIGEVQYLIDDLENIYCKNIQPTNDFSTIIKNIRDLEHKPEPWL